MRKITLLSTFALVLYSASAQKEVQTLQPARVDIFKNGTFFIKREGMVNVTDKSFYIKAPEKVLMGTYWVALGKESSLHSSGKNRYIQSNTYRQRVNRITASQYWSKYNDVWQFK